MHSFWYNHLVYNAPQHHLKYSDDAQAQSFKNDYSYSRATPVHDDVIQLVMEPAAIFERKVLETLIRLNKGDLKEPSKDAGNEEKPMRASKGRI